VAWHPVPLVDPSEVEFTAVRSQGAGGQNVNKVSSAAHLRFDIRRSSLPLAVQERLWEAAGHRVSAEGVLVLKAQEHRSLAMNRRAALERLQAMVEAASRPQIPRKATKPTRASVRERLSDKARRGRLKAERRPNQE
jgi:ribosome-associated protein